MNNWRFIKTAVNSCALNMALDEACMNAVREGTVLPTMRLYRWQPSAISIGYFQSLKREVDLDACKHYEVDVVRRQTGGGAVYHDYDGEITYSIVAPESFFSKNIIESYQEMCGWVINGLKTVGIDAEFVPINDIVVAGKKISGNAQTRKRGVLLQHGTILCNVDVKKMFSLLKVPDEKMRDKLIAVVEDRVTSIHHLKPELDFKAIEIALFDSFTAGKEVKIQEWTEKEQHMARELAQEKYGSNDWNFKK